MSSLIDSLLSDTPRLAGLLIAVLAMVVAVAAYWLRQRPSVYAGVNRQAPAQPAGGIIYRDTPTVRMVDSQRIDRTRKIARLAPGEFVDVQEDSPRRIALNVSPRFRITLKRVVRVEDGTSLAHIAVDFGGTTVSCGPLVEEIAFNEFVLPRAARDEPRNSVFHYQENGDSLDFMRIKLRGVDMDADIAEIDVWQVSGHWPATE